jgi:flagellar hook-basal body complex protein FliE
MADNILPVGPSGPQKPKPTDAVKPEMVEGQASFKEVLEESIDKVNQLQMDADKMLERFLNDDPDVKNEHVMVAFRKAQVAFETLMQIRNKLTDAYEQIQQMRI